MYGMVHTMIGIMYALNVLSRYGNNPGSRCIEFLKHLLKYCKYSKMDRPMFHTHDGPTDIDALLDTGSLAGDFIAEDIVVRYNLKPVLSDTSYTVS